MDANGIISTIAGNGSREWGTNDIPDGTHAMAARLNPTALAMGPDGVLHILHSNNQSIGPGGRVFRLEADGYLRLVAGCATSTCTGTVGMDAKTVNLKGGAMSNYSLAVSPSGTVYFAGRIGPANYALRQRTMRVDGDGLLQVLFDGDAPYVEGEVAAQVPLTPSGLAFGENTLVVAEQYNHRVTSIVRGVGGLGADGLVASASGDELYVFSVDGRHVETKDAFTHSLRYAFDYDEKGRLVTVTDHRSGTPRVTTIERDVDGNATALVAPFGQRTELTINAEGYLETVEFPNADAYHMTYSGDGLMTSFTNPMGGISEMQYDSMGRITVDEDAVGGALTFARTDFQDGWSVQRQTPLDRTTTHRVDLLKDGAETLTNSFPDGTVAIQSREADESRVSYLADGTTVETTLRADPRWGSDSSVKSTTTTLPSGLQRVENRQRNVVLADALDPLSMNNFEETVTVNGRITRRKYVPATRTFTTTSDEGRINVRELDASGRVVRTQSGGLLPFIYSYNNDGMLETATRGSRVVQYGYFTSGPAAGTLESILDPGSQLTTLTRDALGRITSAERAAAVTSFAWDNNSNLVSVTPPGKPAHAMQYTPVNLLSEYQPPSVTGVSTPETTYSYDLDRAIDEITRPDGIVVDHTYDTAGRLESVSVPGATITQSYYPAPADPSIIPPGEAPGRLQSVSGPYGTVLTYTYDGRLPLSETVSGAVTGSVSWTYNADLVHTSQSVTTGSGTTTTAYGYDGDLLTTCASPTTCPSGNDALTLTRGSQHGLVTGLTQGNVSETWSYNTYGELASKAAAFGATPLVSVVYDASGAPRDAQGRVVQKTENRGGTAKSHQYTYDNLGRLSTVSLNGVLAEEYTYDDNGNRLTAFEQGSGTSTAYYDDQDRLLSYGDYEYSYGANGELIGKSNTTTSDLWDYTYDAFGNRLSVSLPDGRFIEYITDGRHRRVAKKIDGTTVRQWLYQDGLNPVAELDGSGALLYQYVYASSAHSPDFVVDATGAVYRVTTDQLGSPLLIVNVADVNDVLLEAEYSAFGERTVLAGDGDALTLGFAGGVYDPDTGLTRFGARDYDPSVGRWTAKDPIRFDAGTNQYGYADGDPSNFVDPDGEIAVAAAALAAGYGAVAAAGLYAWFINRDTIEETFADMCRDSSRDQADPDEVPDDCGAEWASAHQRCAELLTGRRTRTNGRMRGGHENLFDCAKGFVSQRCGGNAI